MCAKKPRFFSVNVVHGNGIHEKFILERRDKYDFVGAIVIAPSSIGATPYYVGAATITLDSIGATTTALDYSRFYRVRGLITPTLVGAALDTPTYVGA